MEAYTIVELQEQSALVIMTAITVSNNLKSILTQLTLAIESDRKLISQNKVLVSGYMCYDINFMLLRMR